MASLLERALDVLPAIAIATGPSYRKIIGVDIPQSCHVYACSYLARHVQRIDSYMLADTSHIPSLPPYPCDLVITHSGMLNWNFNESDDRVFEWTCDPWKVNDWKKRSDIRNAEVPISEAIQTGVFTLMMALQRHNTVGVLGFDGFNEHGISHQENMPERETMQYVNKWLLHFFTQLKQERPDAKLVSLMDATVFRDYMTPAA